MCGCCTGAAAAWSRRHVKASGKGDALLGEQASDDRQPLVREPAAHATVELKRFKLVEEIADAQAECDAPP
jgi:hypothetical protein